MTASRQLTAISLATLFWASLVGCGASGAECRSDARCAAGEQCVSAGGVLASGGTCIADGLLGDDIGPAQPDDAEATDVEPTIADTTSDTSPDGEVRGCETGETRPCYNGTEGTAGVGVCAEGTQTCRPDSTWGECIGETRPSNTECDGTDTDCDGVVDEGCSCDYIDTSMGVCADATRSPAGECTEPDHYESDESSCDDLDNDCDGVVDERCYCDYDGVSTGVCGDGTIEADTGDCLAPADFQETEQSCDDRDNDCDGEVDDEDSDLSCNCTAGETVDCYTGLPGTRGEGICEAGQKTCDSGSWGNCTGETLPSPEQCDGTDDDCDGVVDEQCTCDYSGTSEGVCSDGVIDGSDGTCTAPVDYEAEEMSCDNLDNDCDGSIDEGLLETYYVDDDGDGYGDPANPKEACSKPTGYVPNEEDCYDQNTKANPDQTGRFEQHRGDGNFDYNCDGKEERLITESFQCQTVSPGTCKLARAGWAGSIPDCGTIGDWLESCKWSGQASTCVPGNATSRPQECR